MSARRSLDSEKRFVFGDAPQESLGDGPHNFPISTEAKTEATERFQKPASKGRKKDTAPRPPSPWSDLEAPEKEASVRLNVDISLSLNDKLAAKARQLRKPKTELIRHLLEWALNESNK